MKNKAVFLDRDGVINRERGEHTWLLKDLELLPDVAEALIEIRKAGYLPIVITNQSGIGLGLYDHGDVKRAHDHLAAELDRKGAAFTDIFYCPHHPQQGRCLCRKPGSLLIERAIARYGIDPSASIMIGDRERDVQAAEAVGIRGILVVANSPLLPLVKKELSER